MKTHLSLVLLALSASSLAAQTAPKPATGSPVVVHHTGAITAVRTPGCSVIPVAVSPKIPALPTGVVNCAKSLYTLTRTPDTKLVYVSPLVSPEVRESISAAPTTYSLLYIDLKVGTGEAAKPKLWYSVHYTGYLPDGTKFDSSLDRGEPISFPYGGHRVIQGWDTAFEGMKVGGKRRLFVPFQLAYGEAGRPPVIPAKSELIFDVELVAQSETQPAPKPAPAPPTPATPPPASSTTPPPADKPATPPAEKPATPSTDKPTTTVPKL